MRPIGLTLALLATAAPAFAKSPRAEMFPGDSPCYRRHYSKAHLADHPDQLVTDIAIGPWQGGGGSPQFLILTVEVQMRGDSGLLTSAAYCENAGGELVCGMEGDAGSFSLSPGKDRGVTLKVGRHGMHFEGNRDFVSISGTSGDDRSFYLPRTTADACP